MSSQHDHDRGIMAILVIVVITIILGIISIHFSGCASINSVKSVDWTNVVQQVKFYYDQIPPEQIEQLKDALNNLK